MDSDIFYTGIDETQLLNILVGTFAIAAVISLALAVTMYVLNALGLYKVARRRDIKRPWLAWVPLADYWILGSIADHYRRVSLGQERNRRVLLTVLQCTYMAISLLQSYFAVTMVITIMENAETMDVYELEQMVTGFERQIGSESAVSTLVSMLSLAGMVFYYICLHDFYASCRPANKNVFLVLSIIIPVTEPFFVFACRYAELGMPPKDENQEYTLPPAQPSEPREDTDGGLWKDS